MSGYGPEMLLCHHGDDEAGHENVGTCPVVVKVGRYAQPDLYKVVEAHMRPDVLVAIREVQAGRRCGTKTDKGALCRNRTALTAWPEMVCVREVQAGRRCGTKTDKGALCRNRTALTAWPEMVCGVHA